MTTVKMMNEVFMYQFVISFNKLMQLPAETTDKELKYALKKSLPVVQKAYKEYTQENTEIYEDAATKDTGGNPKMIDNKYQYDSTERRKGAIKKVEELNSKVIELALHLIKPEYLKGVNLTVQDEISLGDFIIQPEKKDSKIINIQSPENL